MFWDTVQFAAQHPNWYYFNDFKYFLLPDYCDSGHPPAFGMYLAVAWKIFGRSLWVSHTAMLPFVALLVYEAVRVGEAIFHKEKRQACLLALMVLSEAVLLTQCTLVSPDIWLMAFFLMAANAVLRGKKTALAWAVVFLAVVSTRAMMVAVCVYLFALVLHWPESKQGANRKIAFFLRELRPFLPGAMMGAAYLCCHYFAKGWIGYHKDSPWAAGFQLVEFRLVLRHVFILSWRLADLGKVATAAILAVLLCLFASKKLRFDNGQEKRMALALVALLLILFIFTGLSLTVYRDLLTHRYLLPITITMDIVVAMLLYASHWRRKNWVLAVMFICQLSGHFWTYPQQISQGWEGSLGHLYFYGMRRDFMNYLGSQKIKKEDVATCPGLIQSPFLLDLQTDTTSYKFFKTDTTRYVWYCNALNAMNKEAAYYFGNFDILKQEKKGNVEMVLFRRSDSLMTRR
ncbi:MAG: hypothetical protein QM642_05295 [Edaphocola sp.]